jgi:hypothetical protein
MEREMIAGGIRAPLSGRSVGGYTCIRTGLTDDRSFEPAVFVGSAKIEKEMQLLK